MSDKAALIQALINQHLPTTIVEKYQTPDRLRQNENLVLGIAISSWAEWDGLRIMEVFAEALSDANFHTESSEVHHWIELLDDEAKWSEYWKYLQGE